MNRARLRDQLVRHEGLRLKPYRDTVGKLTIGVGRNLDDVGLTEEEAYDLLSNDVDRTERSLRSAVPCFGSLDDARQRVLADMAFNLGVTGLLQFKKMLAAVEARDFDLAASEMLGSAWAGQVKGRAETLARMMKRGED
ncbi:MAG: glycoside hydrolase family protein [Egibacteraceae bacterium]